MPYRVNAYRYLSGQMIEMNHDHVLGGGLIAPKLLGRIAVISKHDPIIRMGHLLPNPATMGLEHVGPPVGDNSLNLDELVDRSVALLQAAAENTQSPMAMSQLDMDIPYNQRLALGKIGSIMGVRDAYWDNVYIASNSIEAVVN